MIEPQPCRRCDASPVTQKHPGGVERTRCPICNLSASSRTGSSQEAWNQLVGGFRQLSREIHDADIGGV